MKTGIKIFHLITLIFLVGNNANSQNENAYEFIGALTTESEQVISYKVVIESVEDDQFKGYSITDFYGPDFTRSNIEGYFNSKKNKITFIEKKNVNTSADADPSSFCYVSVENLKIRSVKEKNIIHGPFSGKFPSGDKCAEGVLYLVSSNFFKELRAITDTMKSDSLSKLKKVVESVDHNTDDVVLKSNHKLNIDGWGEKVELELWDGNVEDNDIIDIYVDGELFKDKIVLKNLKQSVALSLKDNHHEVVIYARSEGFSGINTVNFQIRNVNGISDFTSELKKGESFSILFDR